MQQGLLYCGSDWSSVFCITKLIESILSMLLIMAIVYEIVAQIKQTGTFTYRFVEVMQTLMLFTLIYNIAFALDHSIFYLYYLESLFYDWYFCTLVFYVTYKIFTKERNKNQNRILLLKIVFSFLILVFVGIFIYSVALDVQTCEQIWFLVVDILSLLLCVAMIAIGRNHQRSQLQKILDFSNSQQIKNPLSRMWILIFVNLACQVAELIESLIFLIRGDCQFSQDQTTNRILKVMFSLMSLHTSFICTIILFRLRRKGQLDYMKVTFDAMKSTTRSFSIDYSESNQLEMIQYRKSQS